MQAMYTVDEPVRSGGGCQTVYNKHPWLNLIYQFVAEIEKDRY